MATIIEFPVNRRSRTLLPTRKSDGKGTVEESAFIAEFLRQRSEEQPFQFLEPFPEGWYASC